jgi:hypothetical protein
VSRQPFTRLWLPTDHFLGASVSFVASVRRHNTTRRPLDGYSRYLIRGFFENLSRKLKSHYSLTRITGTLHEDLCIFTIPR